MTYEISLRYGQRIANVPPHSIGGTIVRGGDSSATLNVTYNYRPFFIEHLGDEGIFELYGKRANQTIPLLERVVGALSTFIPDEDYWKTSAGNAGRAFLTLLEWARLHPRAIWKVLS